ncbi:MAG TPA: epoxide hydrolase, partial [Solirubrobacteraceae bacterium]
MADPFPVEVAEDAVADLRARLRATRWPEPETVDDWSQGIPLAYMREVCDYWAEEYDPGRIAARLNAVGSFRTTVDGLGTHFLHARSPEDDALPLVITHGWPGSVLEFLGVLGPLTDPAAHGGDPADAFHVVCPALPGYGFSDKPAGPGWGLERIAGAWAELMTELGYERFGAQGGDWGAFVTVALTRAVPERLAGIHLNMATVSPAELEHLGELTEAERDGVAALRHYRQVDSGYAKQQSTRPQTLGYGLVDSPAGQAAWILEKFWAWTDHAGRPDDAVPLDVLLDNVTLYWLTNT